MKKYLYFVGVSFLAAAIGGFFTSEAVLTWYPTLNKPSFSPPNWLFGPVWTVLYLMMGLAGAEAMKRAKFENQKISAIGLFHFQLILNALWSFLFFGLQNPEVGFYGIVALWVSILACIVYYWSFARRACYLLLPYLAWVSFASVLNYFVWILNR